MRDPLRLVDRMRASGSAAEQDAAARAWPVVHAALAEREPARKRRRGRRRHALAAAVVALIAAAVAALALTAAGAKVGHWIGRTVDPSPPGTVLPAPGRLLVTDGSGAWVVSHDLGTRWLGPYATAGWSAHDNFVVATGRDRLVAVEPDGPVRWTLTRPAVSHAVWSGGDGFRIAYRSRDVLRVVAGDGTGDRWLAGETAPVTPAWRPGPSGVHVLAYATTRGRVVVRDVDAPAAPGGIRFPAGAAVRALAWAGPDRLLVLRRRSLLVLDGDGRLVRAIVAPADSQFTHVLTTADGRRFAYVLQGGGASVWTGALGSTASAAARVSRQRFAGEGSFGAIAFSPDGRWVGVDWPAADEWVFVRVTGRPRVTAISGIRRLLAPGPRSMRTPNPPRGQASGIAGWAP